MLEVRALHVSYGEIPALSKKERVRATLPIRNTERAVGTMLFNQVTLQHVQAGLPEGTIQVTLLGSAGQADGASS